MFESVPQFLINNQKAGRFNSGRPSPYPLAFLSLRLPTRRRLIKRQPRLRRRPHPLVPTLPLPPPLSQPQVTPLDQPFDSPFSPTLGPPLLPSLLPPLLPVQLPFLPAQHLMHPLNLMPQIIAQPNPAPGHTPAADDNGNPLRPGLLNILRRHIQGQRRNPHRNHRHQQRNPDNPIAHRKPRQRPPNPCQPGLHPHRPSILSFNYTTLHRSPPPPTVLPTKVGTQNQKILYILYIHV